MSNSPDIPQSPVAANQRTGTADLLWTVLLGAGLIGVLLGAAGLPPGFAQRLCARLGTVALLLATWETNTGLGHWCLQKLGCLTRRTLESRVQALAVGWGLLTAVWTGLAIVGCYRSACFWPVFLLAWIFWGRGHLGTPSGWELWSDLPCQLWLRWLVRHRAWTVTYSLLLAVLVVAGLWALGPVWDVDSEMYHLPNAQYVLKTGSLAADHSERLRNHPGGIALWYGLGLSVRCEGFAAGLMWQASLATSLLAGGMAARWIGQRAAWATIPAYWTGMVILAVGSTPRVEPAYSLWFLTAVSLLLPVVEGHAFQLPTALLAGFCLGTAAATKYQGLYGWVIIGAWLTWEWLRFSRLRSASYLAHVFALFLIAITVASPWWIRNTWAFGNPIYPMFAPPIADSLRHANPHGPHRELGWDYLIRDTIDLFSRPNSFSGPPHHYPHYLFLLLPMWALFRPNRTALRCVLLGFGYLVLSDTLAREIRHMIPLFSLWAIAVGGLLATLELRWRLRVLMPGLLSFLLAFVAFFPARLVPLPRLVPYLLAITDERPVLDRITPGYHQMLDWCNAHTPADSTILMCWEMRIYRLERASIPDPGRATWRTLFANGRDTPEEIAAYLRSEGVDYVLFNDSALNFDVMQAQLLPLETLELVRKQKKLLVPAVLEPVHKLQHITLYRVRKREESLAAL